jgi:RNA polymerase sigma-70 factor (ECF subfamily)
MNSFGTGESIRRAVETHSRMLLRVAMTRLSNPQDAEDAVQETFVQLLSAKPKFRDAEHEKAWLIRTTLYRAGDLRRAIQRRGGVPLDEAAVEAPPPSGDEDADRIRCAVQTLPERYSAVIHLYYYEGYSIREIAKLLALPAPIVGTRLARGREKLREILKEEIE